MRLRRQLAQRQLRLIDRIALRPKRRIAQTRTAVVGRALGPPRATTPASAVTELTTAVPRVARPSTFAGRATTIRAIAPTLRHSRFGTLHAGAIVAAHGDQRPRGRFRGFGWLGRRRGSFSYFSGILRSRL